MNILNSEADIINVKQKGLGALANISMTSEDELPLLEGLRNGDEYAFMLVTQLYHRTLLRLAMIYVHEPAVAEEVVQETWMGIFQGLKRFEGRSSLKTWIFRILTNCAKTSASREIRSIPFSSLSDERSDADESDVEAEHFFSLAAQWPGTWASLTGTWNEIPEERLLSQETILCIERAIKMLPPGQRSVMALRDIEGRKAEDVCNLLGISEANQRVLLHRARSKVRRSLEQYFDEEEEQ